MDDEKQLEKEKKKFAAAMGHEPSLEAVDDKGRTDLHHAATLNLPGLATSLLHSGADVNAKDKDGLTPLHIATMRNEVAVVEFLLDNGADANAKNYHENLTPLHIATMRNVFRVAELLLEHGADVNAKTSEGWTPLFLAIRKKDMVSVVLRFFGFETRMVRLLRWNGGEK